MRKTVIMLLLSILLALYFLLYGNFDSFSLSSEDISLLLPTLVLMLVVATLCFIVSEITKNYSQTDKLWNIVPSMYTWIFAYQSGFSMRLVIMALLVTLWSIRISFNFWRRGGMPKNILKFWEGEEDYRWSILCKEPMFLDAKGNTSSWKWSLFNLVFISYYQHVLIWLFTLPAYKVMLAQAKISQQGNSVLGLNVLDYIGIALMLTLILIEIIADQQQYNFQTEKYRRIRQNEALGEYAHGFVDTGLWKHSRHPNFLAEQLIWLSFYLFSVAASGEWLNISILGVVLLILLFQGSARFSESVSASKYPLYAHYQQHVGMFIPKFSSYKRGSGS